MRGIFRRAARLLAFQGLCFLGPLPDTYSERLTGKNFTCYITVLWFTMKRWTIQVKFSEH